MAFLENFRRRAVNHVLTNFFTLTPPPRSFLSGLMQCLRWVFHIFGAVRLFGVR